MSEIALRGNMTAILNEYEQKRADLDVALATAEAAGKALELAATVNGTYGRETVSSRFPGIHTLRASLLKSAWLAVYEYAQIARIAPAADKKRFEQDLVSPMEFTIENVRATFGKYLSDPHHHILRGLAEVFSSLDPFYKSHERVKIGVKGLPKRIILSNVGSYGSWGRERLADVLNALAAYQGKMMIDHTEIDSILKDGMALIKTRGVYLQRFRNGNGHLYFEPEALLDINRALAEWYGEVLPDAPEERPATKEASTAVAKDLQYYPTPRHIVTMILDELYGLKGARVLEPSCGDGRFLDELRRRGADAFGIEINQMRAIAASGRGHKVYNGNFLTTAPSPTYDRVVMNPPFYGKHYVKHVEHALKWLKPGGTLTAILPASARYDHGLLDGRWHDLPSGSFSESGTNIATTVLTIHK